MGQSAASHSPFFNKVVPSYDFDEEDHENSIARRNKRALLLDVSVAHYMPATFPLVPIMNKSVVAVCKESWKIIMNQTNSENGMSGITVFYTEFYELLEKFDSTGKFDAVLTRHSSGMNKIAAKGAILLRIISFVLAIDVDNPKQLQYSLHMLGKSHSHKQIRPWQYSVFIQTLLNTIASRLGNHASHETMCAWVNLFAFVMKTMLPPAIKDQIVETELNANVTSALGGESAKQLQEVEEARQSRLRMAEGSKSLSDGSSIDARSHH